MATTPPWSYHTDPQLFLFTSLSSGSSQIVTATSRMQTILKANKIAYQAVDVATDEKARMLWGRRSGGKRLPGLVKLGMVLGDLEQIEEWNEYGELEENLEDDVSQEAPAAAPSTTPVATTKPTPSASADTSTTPGSIDVKATTDTAPPPIAPPLPSSQPKKAESTAKELDKADKPVQQPEASQGLANAMRSIGFEVAKRAEDAKIKARKDRIEAAKAKDPELREKLDAKMRVKTDATAESKGEPDEGPKATEAIDSGAKDQSENEAAEVTAGASDPAHVEPADVASPAAAEEQANVAIAGDTAAAADTREAEGEVDYADIKSKDVPPADAVEAEANKAILEDKTRVAHDEVSEFAQPASVQSSEESKTPATEPVKDTEATTKDVREIEPAKQSDTHAKKDANDEKADTATDTKSAAKTPPEEQVAAKDPAERAEPLADKDKAAASAKATDSTEAEAAASCTESDKVQVQPAAAGEHAGTTVGD